MVLTFLLVESDDIRYVSKIACPAETIKDLIDTRQLVLIGNQFCVEESVINTEAPLLVPSVLFFGTIKSGEL